MIWNWNKRYVNYFNKHRIYGTLGYMTPVQYRKEALKKAV
ncbi:IS3 family transposase [Paenibacillus ihumii]